MAGILIFFHCATNTGYAIGRLEKVFFRVAKSIAKDDEKILFAYPGYAGELSTALPNGFSNIRRFDPGSKDATHLDDISRDLRARKIRIAVGFDQPVRRTSYAALRRGGIATFISYWGAPMSSIQPGWRLALKRLEVNLSRHGPDHYVFESRAMRDTAVLGRGIREDHTSVAYLGVDETRFRPDPGSDYVHAVFGIPKDRKVVYYSGHMEPRKGVHVIVKAAVDLVVRRGRRDVHFVLLGNKGDEADQFTPIFSGTKAEDHISFGGYRDDVEKVIPGCYLGVIASTGWDSFTMSSLEIASSGLPLLVSNLQGLVETVDDGVTGKVFPVGDARALADEIEALLDRPHLRHTMGIAARSRVVGGFTVAHQVESLRRTVEAVHRKASL
jgi:glycosyltransferase involved in cell wall biosynthesis